jgi:hypothetical protein
VATNEEMFHVVGKAVLEPEYGAWLLAEPVEAAASIGVKELTEDQLEGIKRLDESTLEMTRVTLIHLVRDINKVDIW